MKTFAIACARLLLPVVILAGGVYLYSVLSVPAEAEIVQPAPDKALRSRVKPLQVSDYAVKIETNGIVSPHNASAISAEVTGTIRSITPAFQVGAFFKSGDVLLEIDDRDYQTALKVAKEQNRLARSTLQLAETAHQRMESLVRRNSASGTEFDTTLAALVQARSQVEITAAAINQAERNLERTKITAPYDGRVAGRLVGVGQLVSPGTLLGNVFAVDFAEVRLPIAGSELVHLKLPEWEGDDPVDVQLTDAIDPTSGSRWTAKIVRTEGVLDANSLELFAIARIDDPFALNSDHCILRIGQPVTATIRGDTLRDVVAIPRAAVRRLDRVHLIDPQTRTLRSLKVEPLWSDAQNVVVRDNSIRPGDLLATTMLVYAPEGGLVEIIPEVSVEEQIAAQPTQTDPIP